MRQLRLVAVSEDGSYLILSAGDHEQLALQVDERLHAAIRGDRARLGQLEIQLESQLRPRDIQARIRAGETVDAVAAVAGMPLEKVRRFAGPVLAEREHIAQRAQQATVRRPHGDGPIRTLETVAVEHVASAQADPESIAWDAWRRDDGRWQVSFSWPEGSGTSSALFSFDPSGRSVVPEDDTARIASGELKPVPVVEAEPALPTGPARLSVVAAPVTDDTDDDSADDNTGDTSAPTTELPVASAASAGSLEALVRATRSPVDDQPDDTDDHLADTGAAARRSRRNRYGRSERRRRDQETWDDHADDEPTSERLHLSDIAEHVVDVGQPAQPPADDDAPHPPKTRKTGSGSARSRRPSVPSWDEIMFGRRKPE
jgi:hypothetical protein